MILLLLGLSIVLSTGRALFSKKLSYIRFGSNSFFRYQSITFLFGGCALFIFGNITFDGISFSTIIYAVVYGLLLICAQWFYTAALSTGNTALCSTVYSMGFIIPTLSGAFFWSEPFSTLDFLGVMCAIAAILFSGNKPRNKTEISHNRYFIPLTVAMLASGGLGVVQKLQQNSPYANEKSLFLLIAFLLASAISVLASSAAGKKQRPAFSKRTVVIAACIGLFFGCCNLLNTILAGALDSKIFFPTLNIGIILTTLLCSVVFYKEKIKRNDLFVLLLGSASILLLNIR